MEFRLSEPCELPTGKLGDARWIFGGDLNDIFWKGVPARKYKNKIGCYLFATQEPAGEWLPWYAGMTQRSMSEECFTPSKMICLLGLLNYSAGTPYAFFIIPMAKKAEVSTAMLLNIENFLIANGRKVNKFLFNQKGRVYRPSKDYWEIYSTDEEGKTQEIFCELLNFPPFYLGTEPEEVTDSPWEQLTLTPEFRKRLSKPLV
jgi:hypothetical protein